MFFGLLFLALLAGRLCHVSILWAEEDLPLAAAVQMLHGKPLYQHVWFDKPPLVPAICLLWGARTGWPLRAAGALFALACCWLAYRFAREMWGRREGCWAAGLLAFFLTFGIPAAVIPLAADLLMVLPHLAAVWLAWRGRAFESGAAAGVAFLFNSKALFVLAACALWQWRAGPRLLAGFGAVNAAAVAWLAASGSLVGYWEQVWELGFVYAGNTFVASPLGEALRRTANWAGFHAALVLGAAWFWTRDAKSDRARMAAWALLSLAAVTAGWRFFPRYYFQLLPVMVLAAARGIALMGRWRALALVALLAPALRFGPRYAILAADLLAGREHAWRDVAMDRDSRDSARLILGRAAPGDALFVWGYRPDIYVYTRLPAASRFLESQPLTGVFADRHLTQSAPVEVEAARRRREELARTRPAWVVDGLGTYNPSLALERYPELREWLAAYEVAGRTGASVIYQRTAHKRD